MVVLYVYKWDWHFGIEHDGGCTIYTISVEVYLVKSAARQARLHRMTLIVNLLRRILVVISMR